MKRTFGEFSKNDEANGTQADQQQSPSSQIIPSLYGIDAKRRRIE